MCHSLQLPQLAALDAAAPDASGSDRPAAATPSLVAAGPTVQPKTSGVEAGTPAADGSTAAAAGEAGAQDYGGGASAVARGDVSDKASDGGDSDMASAPSTPGRAEDGDWAAGGSDEDADDEATLDEEEVHLHISQDCAFRSCNGDELISLSGFFTHLRNDILPWGQLAKCHAG